jgi:hypothetical protein
MVKKTLKKHKVEKVEEINEMISEKTSEIKAAKKFNLGFVIKLVLVILVGSAIFLLAQKYKNLVIAGVVNNKPISRFELMSRLNSRYGKTAFDEIVTERLIYEQATKNGVTVSAKEIQDEVAANEKQFGGKTQLMDMAKQAGINDTAQLNEFFKLKLTIKKLQDKLFKAEVTTVEVKKYYDDNKQYLGDKKFEDVQKEITDQLVQQKIQTQFTDWFGKIRTDSKINSYI